MAISTEFASKKLDSVNSSTLVLFTNDIPKGKKLTALPKEISKEDTHKIADNIEESPFKGNLGDTLFFRAQNILGHTNLLLIGLGDTKKVTPETLRRAASHALKNIKAQSVKTITICLDSITLGKDKELALNALFEGLYLTDYTFEDYKTASKEKGSDKLSFTFHSKQVSLLNSAKAAQKSAQIISDGVALARRLGDHPGNKMTPPILANTVKKEAQNISGLKVTIWDKARIEKEKMGCLAGVGLGNVGGGPDPRFIIMEYNGGTKGKKPVCLVGKGLTFDSGGICLKPGAGMEEMKYDMQGGAAVIGAMFAIARLKLKVNVIGLVPSSENMPGPLATKPGDISTARNGKTVEVINTDAEGRLILADALCYAAEQDPEFIVDAATLTGAMVMALGDTHTGFFSRDAKLTEKVYKASQRANELCWEMPMHEEFYKDMKGNHADLQNISQRKGAGSAHGAVFLAEFVDSKVPWAHFDIAGTAYNNGHRLPYHPAKGASGVIVRTFIELARMSAR